MIKASITTGLGYTKHGDKISQRDAEGTISHAMKMLSNDFGGCTAYQGQGAWVNEQGDLVTEPVFTIEAIGLSLSHDDAKDKAAFVAAYLRDNLGQECVVLAFSTIDASLV
jgi:hypothetical protein